MPIPPSAIGKQLASVTTPVERGRVKFFASAIGERDPIYSDAGAARAAGHPDVVAPLTFLFGLRFDVPKPFQWIEDLGVDMGSVLHGSQRFTYHEPVHAGDVVTFSPTIVNVHDKRNGALEFIEVRVEVTREDTTLVATFEETFVVRHREQAVAA